MPLKKGGYDQLGNLQAFGGRRQVIFAIGTHDSTVDTGGLHPLLAAGAANLAAAGIPDRIRQALSDAGYASEDNFTAPCDAELYIAVTRESRQAGQLHDGAVPPGRQPGWQEMAAKLDTPEGQAGPGSRTENPGRASAPLPPAAAKLCDSLHDTGNGPR
jgi:hypothetical protein